MKQEKKSIFKKMFTTEYKYESIISVVLSMATLLIGIYILNGTLTIKPTFPIIGGVPKVFAIIIILLSAVVFLVGIWPIYKPSFRGIKKLTPPTKKTYLDHTLKVFTFIFLLVIVFTVYDTVIIRIISWV